MEMNRVMLRTNIRRTVEMERCATTRSPVGHRRPAVNSVKTTFVATGGVRWLYGRPLAHYEIMRRRSIMQLIAFVPKRQLEDDHPRSRHTPSAISVAFSL